MEQERENAEQEEEAPGLVSWCERLYANMPAFQPYTPRASRRAVLTPADTEDTEHKQ